MDQQTAVPAIQAALSKGIVAAETIKKSLSSPAVHLVADPKTIKGPTRAMPTYQVKLHAINTIPDVDKLFDTSLFEKASGLK